MATTLVGPYTATGRIAAPDGREYDLLEAWDGRARFLLVLGGPDNTIGAIAVNGCVCLAQDTRSGLTAECDPIEVTMMSRIRRRLGDEREVVVSHQMSGDPQTSLSDEMYKTGDCKYRYALRISEAPSVRIDVDLGSFPERRHNDLWAELKKQSLQAGSVTTSTDNPGFLGVLSGYAVSVGFPECGPNGARPGFTVRLESQPKPTFRITDVFPCSSAARAGIMPGDELRRIGMLRLRPSPQWLPGICGVLDTSVLLEIQHAGNVRQVDVRRDVPNR